MWNLQGKIRFKSPVLLESARRRFRDKLLNCCGELCSPRAKETFPRSVAKKLKVAADDSVLSGETHIWRTEGHDAPLLLLPTSVVGAPSSRAAGAPAACGGAVPAPHVGPSIGDSQAAAASIMRPPPVPVPFNAPATPHGTYGPPAAAYPGGLPFFAVPAGLGVAGRAAAAAASTSEAAGAAAAAGANGHTLATIPAPLFFFAGASAAEAAPGAGHHRAVTGGGACAPLSYACSAMLFATGATHGPGGGASGGISAAASVVAGSGGGSPPAGVLGTSLQSAPPADSAAAPPAVNPARLPFSAGPSAAAAPPGAAHHRAVTSGGRGASAPAPLSYAGAATLGACSGVGAVAPAAESAPLLQNLTTPAAAAPTTPDRDERGRTRPSPGSGEGAPGPKRGRLGTSTPGVAKTLDYAETPAAAMAVPPPSAGPAVGPSVYSAIEPQSPQLPSSRPRGDITTPEAAPPKKRITRDDAAMSQRQQTVRQLGYDSATAGGYCISYNITWRDPQRSTEDDRIATRYAIRHAIAQWGARQPLGCVVVGEPHTDGLNFHVYGIHGNVVTMDAFRERVKKISMALDHPRRSRNVRVKHCRFKAKVTHRLSMPEAEVFALIRGVGFPPHYERWCKVLPREQALPARAVPAEIASQGAVTVDKAIGPAAAVQLGSPAALASAFGRELQGVRERCDGAKSPADIKWCFEQTARLVDCAIWYLSQLPDDSISTATGVEQIALVAAGPSPSAGGSGSGVCEEAAAERQMPSPSASASSAGPPGPLFCQVRVFRHYTDCCLASQGNPPPTRRRRGLKPVAGLGGGKGRALAGRRTRRRQRLDPRRRLPGVPARRRLPAPGQAPAPPSLSPAGLELNLHGLLMRQQQRQQVPHVCAFHHICSVNVSYHALAGCRGVSWGTWAGLGPELSPVASSSPAKRALFAAAGTIMQGVTNLFSSLSPSCRLSPGAPAADIGTATVTTSTPPDSEATGWARA